MSTNHNRIPAMSRNKEITVGGEKITVREITWLDTLTLMKKIGAHAQSLVKDGAVKFETDKIAELLAGTQELAEFLITKSTNLDADWLNKLSFPDGLEVLDAALEINLSPEIVGKAKNVGGRLGQALGIKAAVKLTPMPESRQS